MIDFKRAANALRELAAAIDWEPETEPETVNDAPEPGPSEDLSSNEMESPVEEAPALEGVDAVKAALDRLKAADNGNDARVFEVLAGYKINPDKRKTVKNTVKLLTDLNEIDYNAVISDVESILGVPDPDEGEPKAPSEDEETTVDDVRAALLKVAKATGKGKEAGLQILAQFLDADGNPVAPPIVNNLQEKDYAACVRAAEKVAAEQGAA